MQVMDDTDFALVINLPVILLNINIHPHPLKEISILISIPSKAHDEQKQTLPRKNKSKSTTELDCLASGQFHLVCNGLCW